jgi:hypothetical protein
VGERWRQFHPASQAMLDQGLGCEKASVGFQKIASDLTKVAVCANILFTESLASVIQ